MAARASGESSWLATLVGLFVLAVAGFGVGFLAGGFWEAPRLVLTHLMGDTEEVAWEAPPVTDVAHADGTDAESPEELVEIPEVGGAPPVSARPVQAPRPSPASVAARAENLAVQVGAFSEVASAESLAGRLREAGYPAFLSAGGGQGETRWRVRVGPYTVREEADEAASRLKREERLPTWVLDEGA